MLADGIGDQGGWDAFARARVCVCVCVCVCVKVLCSCRSHVTSASQLHWVRVEPAFKSQCRSDVLSMLAGGAPADPKYVKEKVATLAKEIAKRDLPADWPEFFPALEQVSAVGDAQRELVVLVIRRFVEDVVQFSSDLSKTRCDALMVELKSKAKSMLGFLLSNWVRRVISKLGFNVISGEPIA